MLNEIKKELEIKANLEKKEVLQRFFKTGKGEYGEGDIFLGVMTPEKKEIEKKYRDKVSLDVIQELLKSKVHEHRSIGLSFLCYLYEKSKDKKFVDFYLENLKYVNNWDLVDGSASYILGDYLLNKDRSLLYELVKSKNLWERRIAIITTFGFIRNNDFEDTLKLSRLLLKDKHDLMHKAVGWMLREVGKKNLEEEERFLEKYHKIMPRTMLRYSIERFEESKRKYYMGK